MAGYPSNIKKLLQTWSAEAYRRELEREVRQLEKEISAWQRGRISSEELSHRVHEWDVGPSKALVKQYDYGQLDANVAYALVIGILKTRELPEELLEAIAGPLENYRRLKSEGRLADRKGKWW